MKGITQRSFCLRQYHICHSKPSGRKGPVQVCLQTQNTCKWPASYVVISNKQNPCLSHLERQQRQDGHHRVAQKWHLRKAEWFRGLRASPQLWMRPSGSYPFTFCWEWHREHLPLATAKDKGEENSDTTCESHHHCCLEDPSICHVHVCVYVRARSQQREIRGPGSSTEPLIFWIWLMSLWMAEKMKGSGGAFSRTLCWKDTPPNDIWQSHCSLGHDSSRAREGQIKTLLWRLVPISGSSTWFQVSVCVQVDRSADSLHSRTPLGEKLSSGNTPTLQLLPGCGLRPFFSSARFKLIIHFNFMNY